MFQINGLSSLSCYLLHCSWRKVPGGENSAANYQKYFSACETLSVIYYQFLQFHRWPLKLTQDSLEMFRYSSHQRYL